MKNTESIRFRTGSRTSYVVQVPAGTLADIMAAKDWKTAAMAVFDSSPSVWEEFNGQGAAMPSSIRPLADRANRRPTVLAWIHEGYLPVPA